MKLFKCMFGEKKVESSASKAKDRLALILETERIMNRQDSYVMEKLKSEILQVIIKHVGNSDVKIRTQKNKDTSIMELKFNLNITNMSQAKDVLSLDHEVL